MRTPKTNPTTPPIVPYPLLRPGDEGRPRGESTWLSAASHLVGMTVTLRRADGRKQTFRIVGEDEADPPRGTVSYVCSLARTVLTYAPGETIEIAGGGELSYCTYGSGACLFGSVDD